MDNLGKTFQRQHVLTPRLVHQLIHSSQWIQLVDARTPGEGKAFEYSIENSLRLPPSELLDRIHELKPYEKHDIVILTEDGKGGQEIVDLLWTLGFSNVYVLEGGLRAWAEAQLPLVLSEMAGGSCQNLEQASAEKQS
jgi:rhodanese-related sulfurtransferase